MVKAIWAVACLASVPGICLAAFSGYGMTKSQIQESNKMDVGEGPRKVLVQLAELQKEPAGRRIQGPPPFVASNTTTGGTVFDPSVYPSGYLSTSRAAGATPDAQPSVTPEKAPPPVIASSTPLVPSGNAVAEDYSGGPKYRVGPEDILHVSVWGNKDLTLDVPVRPDGKISLPLIQDVQAEGLTASELADVIHQKLLAYIKEPAVSLMVKEVNAAKFYVLGYVNKPGIYALRGDMSVLQALSMAGGLAPFASARKIRLLRNINGTQKVRVINYNDLIDSGEGNYLLKPSDTIVVP